MALVPVAMKFGMIHYVMPHVMSCFAVNVGYCEKVSQEPCVQTLCAQGIFGSYEGLVQYGMSHMSQFVYVYHISFHYHLQLKVKGCDLWCAL